MNRMTDRVARTGMVRTVFFPFLRRVPFTAATVAAILTVTALTNTLAHPITTGMLDRWGFGLDQLLAGRAYQVFFSPFQVLRPYMAVSIFIMVLLFVGACEYRLRTRRTMIAFWGGHIAGSVGGVVVLALLGRAGLSWAAGAARTADVGASNGALGALGVTLLFLGGRTRRIVFVLVSVYLLLALYIERRNWDVEHILAFAAGLALGRVYYWRAGADWPGLLPRWQLEKRHRPRLMSWAVRVTGIVNILAAFLLPHHAGFARLEAWSPLGGPHWPRHLLLVAGLALIALAPGLARRQRTAWWGAVVALSLSLLLHLELGITWLEALVTALFFILLILWRREFRAPARNPSRRSALALFGSLVIAIPLYGLVGFFVLRSRFDPPVTLAGALVDTLRHVFFLAEPWFVASGRPARWFLDSIPVVAWLAVVYAIVRVVRSAVAPGPSPTDIQLAWQLLKRHGQTGTSYMTLWTGNSIFFGPAQNCYVAYRVHSGVAIALGDPVGDPVARVDAVRAFTDFAIERGWIPVFYAATAALLDDYRSAGYEALQIGEEGVVSLPDLEFRGKEWQNVRSAINRADRSGVSFQMWEGGTIPPPLRAQLFEISAEWAARHELPSMGFTLGNTGDVDDPNVNVGLAVDTSQRVLAYVDWLPVYARRGWVIDLMRRRDDAMKGVMDYLIGMSFLAFKERGYDSASLAAAPLADIDRGDTTSPLEWVLGRVYETSHTYYDFRSLFQYKEKFHPRWEGVYLAHRGLSTLPAVATALTRAYFPALGLVEATRILGESAARRLFPRQ